MKYTFTGHDTFHCRNYWLKKGLDHLWDDEHKTKFNDQAVISLGVGRNMVTAIRFWLKAFGLTNADGQPTELAERLFKEDGYDPYCEDIGTIWLLHYLLVTSEIASTYHLLFNKIRKRRIEFTKEQLLFDLERSCRETKYSYHQNSINKDIDVFRRNYTTPAKSKGIEEDFSGLLYELGIVQRLEKSGTEQWYKIENKERTELPAEIILFCLLKDGKLSKTFNSISFSQLLKDTNSVGAVFALNSSGLMFKIEQLLQQYKKHLVFADDGGIRLLQLKKELNPWDVLNNYYGI